MKRIISTYLAVVASFLLSTAAHAVPFTFSYLFDDGTSISGSLNGTQSGNYVVDVIDVVLEINAIDVGSTDLFSYWVYVGTSGETPVISFDGTLNNFWFADTSASDSSGNIIGDGDYGFALIGSSAVSSIGPSDRAYVNDAANGVSAAQFADNGSWKLIAVPEPGTLLLLGLGLAGIGFGKRKQA